MGNSPNSHPNPSWHFLVSRLHFFCQPVGSLNRHLLISTFNVTRRNLHPPTNTHKHTQTLSLSLSLSLPSSAPVPLLTPAVLQPRRTPSSSLPQHQHQHQHQHQASRTSPGTTPGHPAFLFVHGVFARKLFLAFAKFRSPVTAWNAHPSRPGTTFLPLPDSMAPNIPSFARIDFARLFLSPGKRSAENK